MSIKIIKKGISDRIIDAGRFGFQHLGIQPSGPMDFLSAQLANTILDNDLNNPVFELHFPASVFEFEETMFICICGANFVPVINDKSVELNTPIQVYPKDQLSFLQPIEGRSCYLAFKGKLDESKKWLNSFSSFQTTINKGDHFLIHKATEIDISINPFKQNTIQQVQKNLFNEHEIRFIPGPAWNDLDPASIQVLMQASFTIDAKSNRMGYLFNGPAIHLSAPKEYLSSAVTMGTIQLLPNGQIIVLMADHQTIGGYANLGQIILVDLPRFAQMKNGQLFKFSLTNIETAQTLYRKMYAPFKH
jgi:antagonist of KipI